MSIAVGTCSCGKEFRTPIDLARHVRHECELDRTLYTVPMSWMDPTAPWTPGGWVDNQLAKEDA